ncbi:MAG: hypothetical protein JXR37_31785 [Kiritimatiellae bacterium]|nr:hypothetical protein [Kiritimatiellia bacterium]
MTNRDAAGPDRNKPVARWLARKDPDIRAFFEFSVNEGENSKDKDYKEHQASAYTAHLLVTRAILEHPHWLANPEDQELDDALAGVAEETKFSVGFLHDLALQLLGSGPRTPAGIPYGSVAVPVAGLDGPGEGLLAQFVLELVCKRDCTALHIAPEQIFLRLDNAFLEPFKIVPSAVQTLREESWSGGYVRVRVLDLATGEPIETALYGDSAGGAVAWGLYHLLAGKVAEPRIVVMAAVPNSGVEDGAGKLDVFLRELGPGVVAPKVQAVVEHNARHDPSPNPNWPCRFDTIVVAGPADKEEALKELHGAHIDVVNLEEQGEPVP